MRHAKFISNTAKTENGGGMRTEGGDEDGSEFYVEHCTFTRNTAGGHGGGIWVYDMADEGSFASFVSNTLTYNTAGSDGSGSGGGVYVSSKFIDDNGSARFNYNWIEGNRAADDGGGAKLDDIKDGWAEIIGNTIISNTAEDAGDGDGGGLWIDEVEHGAVVIMTDNDVNYNEAGDDGEKGTDEADGE